MSEWQGANVKTKVTDRAEHQETIEAALHRLKSAYTNAMGSVGAWHRAARGGDETTPNQEDHLLLDKLVQLGWVARNNLETKVLADPWILKPYASTYVRHRSVVGITSSTILAPDPTMEATPIRSDSHRATVQQLAYLALVNYGDLLLSGLGPNTKSKATLLDRGVVRGLENLAPGETCWRITEEKIIYDGTTKDSDGDEDMGLPEVSFELECDTLRLALVSYLDAVAIDATDPSLWLKLACTARRLNSEQYRPLIRYTLERSISALPATDPPMFIAVRAYQEFCEEPLPETSFSGYDNPATDQLTLDIPRYSWSALGRALLRVGKQGSPNLRLTISPLFLLPVPVLNVLCSFLPSTRALEATCRALSASVLASRTLRNVQLRQTEASAVTPASPKTSVPDRLSLEPKLDHEESETSEKNAATRTSKRVLSQMITSGKRSERNYRRNSVEFCLISAMFGCKRSDLEFTSLLEGEGEDGDNEASTARMKNPLQRNVDADGDFRIGPSSMTSFITKCPDIISPLAALFRFVAHCSCHIGNVIACDPGGSLMVGSCIDWMSSQSLLSEELVCLWTAAPNRIPRDVALSHEEIFSIDLLHCELRFKRCQDEEVDDLSYDSDANFLATTISILMKQNIQSELKVRVLWLASIVHFWIARHCSDISQARETEALGLSLLDDAISCLATRGTSVNTPHLPSHRRKGRHWRELSVDTLKAFKKEKQAAAIVFIAQENFLKATSGLVGQEDSSISEDTLRDLKSIGDSLYRRYSDDLTAENAKYDELVEDFINVFNKVLMALLDSQDISKDPGSNLTEWIDNLFNFHPITHSGQLIRISHSPSILTILFSCLLATRERPLPLIALLFIRVISNLASSILTLATIAKEVDDSDDEGDPDSNKRKGSEKVRCCTALIPVLINKLSALMKALGVSDREELLLTDDFLLMIRRTFDFLGSSKAERSTNEVAIAILRGIRGLLSLTKPFFDVCKTCKHSSLTEYFIGLVNAVTSQLQVLKGYAEIRPKSRAARNKITRGICDFLAEGFCDLALLLSSQPTNMIELSLFRSDLCRSSTSKQRSLLPKLCNTLLWLWNASSVDELHDQVQQEKGCLNWCLDRFGKDRIRLPVASAIASLCGSCIATFPRGTIDEGQEINNLVSLADFYDSDASANDWSEVNSGSRACEELLRVLSQAVNCIYLLMTAIDMDESVRYLHAAMYNTCSGPLFPLVALRSLNRLSRYLINGFSQGVGQEHWELHAYPIGTRSTGALLDECLNKAYHCLHGFVLSVSAEKEGLSNSDLQGIEFYPPEDLDAAVMIYKNIMRVYGQGRRLPPKTAMDAVAAALPANDECTVINNELRSFLFAPDPQQQASIDLLNAVTGEGTWRPPVDLSATYSSPSSDDTTMLRRGLARLIAQGPIPCFQQTGEDGDAVSSSIQNETELARKFEAIVEALSCGSQSGGEEWFKAAQCLLDKADIIADRIGQLKGFTRNQHFSIPDRRHNLSPSYHDLAQLLQSQATAYADNKKEWIPHLGFDLSLVVKHSWSDIVSLSHCAEAIKQSIESNSNQACYTEDAFQMLCFPDKVIDLGSWHRAWGGVFVSSLRSVAYRCLILSLHALSKAGSSNNNIYLEVIESIGSFYYKLLMGSQVYGFPVQIMTEQEKRNISIASLSCFQKAIDIFSTKQENTKVAWDLHFMVGKCNEKIAGTFVREGFSSEVSEREYEKNMGKALASFAKASELAIEAEKDGDIVVDQGGSSHGSGEAVYRLHASRLKCLIAAAMTKEEYRHSAEFEALRLTEKHWFTNVQDSTEDCEVSPRDRVWKVLVDVVEALAKLRHDNNFFHRSVYRHAQALMWAPFLCDPLSTTRSGSLGAVPAAWACKLKGFNCATTAAHSALAVMRSLFGKKRPQLVSAWFDEGAETLVQQINGTVRKYDSLRGKYIAAYIECLTVCKERTEVDTFLRWTSSTPRDLPSNFQAHVESRTGISDHVPSVDCLLPNKSLPSRFFLVSVRRLANGALAGILVNDLSRPHNQIESDDFSRDELKIAFSCFLRLRCDAKTFAQWLRSPYNRDPSIISVANAVTTAYDLFSIEEKDSNKKDILDWSGELQLANRILFCLGKCATLFPSLNLNYSFSKPKPSSKQTRTKRQAEPSTSNKSFEVEIPKGTKDGESFLTTVKHGSLEKTVRLTVPVSAASTIRFSLDMQHNSQEKDEPPAKNAKIG